MEATQKPAVIPQAPPQGASWWDITVFIRRFLSKLIVDILVEWYARSKTDPEFQKRFTDAFAQLDSAKSQAENDQAALAIQDLVSN